MALPVPQASLHGGNMFETVLSALVVVVAVVFMVFFKFQVGTGHLGNYPLRVSLADAGGLVVGSDVRVGGAKIGSVTGMRLEQPGYRAIIEISIRDDLFLPTDSAAAVSSSPFGDVYLSLNPGHAAQRVPADGTIGAARRAAQS